MLTSTATSLAPDTVVVFHYYDVPRIRRMIQETKQSAHNMMTKENKNEKRIAAISADGTIDATAFVKFQDSVLRDEMLHTCPIVVKYTGKTTPSRR